MNTGEELQKKEENKWEDMQTRETIPNDRKAKDLDGS